MTDHFAVLQVVYPKTLWISLIWLCYPPALLTRKLLLRTSPLNSALYELIEWRATVGMGSNTDAFLGSQGDIWDVQGDMASALFGATVAMTFACKLHDHFLRKLRK